MNEANIIITVLAIVFIFSMGYSAYVITNNT